MGAGTLLGGMRLPHITMATIAQSQIHQNARQRSSGREIIGLGSQ